MPKIIFHRVGGEIDIVEADAGVNVMRAAVENDVNGIVGECGGQAMCATCHVFVREPYLAKLPPIGDDEEEMLECTASPRDARRSRLGCQLTLDADLDEVEVDVPEFQV